MWILSGRQTKQTLRQSRAELELLVLERTVELQNLSQRLLRVQDEERRRVARDLHDSTGQTLTALKISVTLLQGKLDHDKATHDELSGIAHLVDEALQEIRTTSYLLHPPLLDDVGLQSAIMDYVKGFAERSGIQVSLDLQASFERLDRDYELSLFGIVQECLTNIHRHSGSKTAGIRISRDDGALVLEVRDEGRGMRAERMSEIQSSGSGVGIRGMRERALQLSGTMSIDSDASGTRIRVVIPTHKTASQEGKGSHEPLQTAV